ncbi:ABC transporter ATP-binding protein [Microbacterium sp. 18062]|uniref:ABC transporter ATP-binding protein n=1 Tax=Microbacterium sp. 18062 TaxID=2681410 RepID=UPI001359BF48|nr:ABC transporter ATP-binding protein [Microbacterium sp. 18062]
MIEVSDVSQVFSTGSGTVHALSHIDLDVHEGEFVALVGRSGCGKSTLLRTVAGLNHATEGTVTIAGTPVTRPRRDVSFMFQKSALLPWRSVLGNVLFPIQLRGLRRRDYLERAHDLLELVGLAGFEKRRPNELSGGMQQRVSLVRSLITEPEVLLMDEPFSALDALTRTELSEELQRVHMETGTTVVFVTHSVEEAVLLADRVVVLSPRPGRIHTVLPIDAPRPRSLSAEQADEIGRYSGILHDLLMRKELE